MERPNPDELLSNLQRETAKAQRGRLKVFFGANAGVGKTYSMLEAARFAVAAGEEVVAGYLESHGRQETDRLAAGLETIEPLIVRSNGLERKEFNLDAALRRRPRIILVDELAHSNIVDGDPPMRHAKRWQDIEELLDAGINVWTTVNVQHIETLNDVVAGITGIRQRETVPDRIFDEADEVELIDLPSDDLLARLHTGKIYSLDKVPAATSGFFQASNLIALRELALRRTADRVDADARELRSEHGKSRPWLARDRFLIAVDANSQAEELIRFGKRFADALDADWVVATVEVPIARAQSRDIIRVQRADKLRFAASLGAETVTLDGVHIADTLVEYARQRNISRIVVGTPTPRHWQIWGSRPISAQLQQIAPDLDVSIIARRAVNTAERVARDERSRTAAKRKPQWKSYLAIVGISSLCTLVAQLMYPHFELSNILMVYLLGNTLIAYRLGRRLASIAAVVHVLLFDFFFVPPRFTFAVADAQYLVTFAVMLFISLTIAALVSNVRAQTKVAIARERRTSLLYGMTRELAAERSVERLIAIGSRHVAEVFSVDVCVLLVDSIGRLVALTPVNDIDRSIAEWVYTHNRPAGLGTDTLPGTSRQYLPLTGTKSPLGVLAVRPADLSRLKAPEQRLLLDTFVGQIGLAIERAQTNEAAEHAVVVAETETLRNTLLASVSHDLRGPLSVIATASGMLTSPEVNLSEAKRSELLATIARKSSEMSELVRDVLSLVRLESGAIRPECAWCDVDEMVSSALEIAAERFGPRTVRRLLAPNFPRVYLDEVMVLQLLGNLLDNAAKYTPETATLEIGAEIRGPVLELWVSDDGPGIPGSQFPQLFEKFHRGVPERNDGGAGLGLAICKTIARLHEGQIVAEPVSPHGLCFRLTLPHAVEGSAV